MVSDRAVAPPALATFKLKGNGAKRPKSAMATSEVEVRKV